MNACGSWCGHCGRCTSRADAPTGHVAGRFVRRDGRVLGVVGRIGSVWFWTWAAWHERESRSGYETREAAEQALVAFVDARDRLSAGVARSVTTGVA